MSEVLVDSQRLVNAEALHHHEAEAVDHAVLLVGMPLEVVEGGSLLVKARPMDAGHLLAVEPLADEDSTLMRDPIARECDRLEDDVVSRDQRVGELEALEFLEDFDRAGVVLVDLGEEREEEARVDEDHSSGSP